MTPRTAFCAYPWDLADDPAAADRAVSTGAEGVAIAAVYHSVRAATPLHPKHRVVDAVTAASYLPVRSEVWRGSPLVPESAAAWAGEESFARAAAVARAAGLAVDAWVVLTHSAVLGARNPELCVQNAAGDVYPYALCPSAEEVRAYAATVTSETVALTDADTLMVEACGPMGVGHLGHHEKTSGADWSAIDENLLSICFCAACRRLLLDEGADPDRLALTVLDAVGRGHFSMEEALGEVAAVVLAVRDASRRRLAAAVSAAARSHGPRRLLFHAHSDPWATGPFAALLETEGLADGFVLPLADPVRDDPRSSPSAVPAGTRVGGYLSALPPADLESWTDLWAPRVRGLDDLYLYHLGLLSQRRLDEVGRLIGALGAPA